MCAVTTVALELLYHFGGELAQAANEKAALGFAVAGLAAVARGKSGAHWRDSGGCFNSSKRVFAPLGKKCTPTVMCTFLPALMSSGRGAVLARVAKQLARHWCWPAAIGCTGNAPEISTVASI